VVLGASKSDWDLHRVVPFSSTQIGVRRHHGVRKTFNVCIAAALSAIPERLANVQAPMLLW